VQTFKLLIPQIPFQAPGLGNANVPEEACRVVWPITSQGSKP